MQGSIEYQQKKPGMIDTIELDIGGRVEIPELEPEEIPDGADEVRVLETEEPQEYLTAQKPSGNGQYTYEFCFRLDGHVATLTTLTRMEDAKDCSRGWIPNEVRDEIRSYHPNLRFEID